MRKSLESVPKHGRSNQLNVTNAPICSYDNSNPVSPKEKYKLTTTEIK